MTAVDTKMTLFSKTAAMLRGLAEAYDSVASSTSSSFFMKTMSRRSARIRHEPQRFRFSSFVKQPLAARPVVLAPRQLPRVSIVQPAKVHAIPEIADDVGPLEEFKRELAHRGGFAVVNDYSDSADENCYVQISNDDSE